MIYESVAFVSLVGVNAGKLLGVLGLLAYLVVGWVPYLVSGLVVPGIALVLLWVVWILGLFWSWRTFRARPAWTLAFAPGALAFWFVYVSIGEQAFGWSA